MLYIKIAFVLVIIIVNKTAWDIYKVDIGSNLTNEGNFFFQLLILSFLIKVYIIIKYSIIIINKTAWNIYEIDTDSNLTNKSNFVFQLLILSFLIKVYIIIRYEKLLFLFFVSDSVLDYKHNIVQIVVKKLIQYNHA